MLVSTLHSYFAGQRELFRGLAIDGLEKDWTAYPVIHLDMSGAKHVSKDRLSKYLDTMLTMVEASYGVTAHPQYAGDRLSVLIDTLRRRTGRQVVVLIDEYEAPLLDVVHKDGELEEFRHIMCDFYSPLKLNEPNLRFVFLTGITKFSQLSIFSELNNITNISMDAPYAGICGITKEELLTQMSDDIDLLAGRLGKDREETVAALRREYDGYHFT